MPMNEAAPNFDEPQQQDSREAERLQMALAAIIGRLERDADDRVSKRRVVEMRWLEDLRQLHGEYDAKTLRDLENAGKSKLFINQTRAKTNACEARLIDMLFPTDDKNWGIKPTPVPELVDKAKEAVAQTEEMVGQANDMQQAGQSDQAAQMARQAQGVADVAQRVKAEQDEAKKRSEAMEAEINDQLVESEYNIQSRDVIRDACALGTGIMKGPIAATDRARRSWQKIAQPDGSVVYQLDQIENPRPAFVRVDPWSLFPDPDARTAAESESWLERHLMLPKSLRALAKQPGFDKAAIRRLLASKQTQALPTYLSDLRNITGQQQAPIDSRYIVWEYRGPLTAEEMRDLCACLDKADMAQQHEDSDPLDEIHVVLWFCQGEVLKFGVHHLDSNEGIYSVYNLEKDESSIWGFGIPYLMRDSQKAMNAAWRMMMDNSGLSSGPQIEIDPQVIEPADGDWKLTARKIWKRRAEAPAGKQGFAVYNIDSHQAELAGIIALAKQFIDDETAISVLAQGEQGAHTTQTANGMAMLMNAVNVVFRRMVKNFDDDMTVPNIRRLYDWNMQFSEKEHIKGDFEVDARGTSVLLVREIQAQNLMVLLQFAGHPLLGMLLKAAPLLRKTVQSMMIAADDVVKTDDEIKRELQAQANQPDEPPPELALKREIALIEADSRLKIAQMNRDVAMFTLAEQRNMTVDDLRTKLQMKEMDTDSKERILASEIAVEARQAAQAAATGQVPSELKGSGGYIS